MACAPSPLPLCVAPPPARSAARPSHRPLWLLAQVQVEFKKATVLHRRNERRRDRDLSDELSAADADGMALLGDLPTDVLLCVFATLDPVTLSRAVRAPRLRLRVSARHSREEMHPPRPGHGTHSLRFSLRAAPFSPLSWPPPRGPGHGVHGVEGGRGDGPVLGASLPGGVSCRRERGEEHTPRLRLPRRRPPHTPPLPL